METGFRCATCGQFHHGLPQSFAADFPDMYANMAEADRSKRALISTDQCIIDTEFYFLRGCLEIPIIGEDEPFLWGVWALLTKPSFDEVRESWEEPGRENLRGPFKGRLANKIVGYPETTNLKLRVQIQPVHVRPLLVIEEEHPLAFEQRSGISRDRADQMAAEILHHYKLLE